MKPGQESQTAVMVCMARAYAHGRTIVPKFDDPTARALLPEKSRANLDRIVSPQSRRDRFSQRFIDVRSKMMALRTVTVDDAVRASQPTQVVILGAGLDGRAWRMNELANATVFEVDHPDSQRRKRERATSLKPVAREIKFVPVDFERDDLEAALAGAGHDATQPTTWIWEGVVMYLERPAIESTLGIVRRRSAQGSTLVIVYNAPTWMSLLVGLALRRVGEPFRSSFTPAQMRDLLARFGFDVKSDHSIPELAAERASTLVRDVRSMKHARIVVAQRR